MGHCQVEIPLTRYRRSEVLNSMEELHIARGVSHFCDTFGIVGSPIVVANYARVGETYTGVVRLLYLHVVKKRVLPYNMYMYIYFIYIQNMVARECCSGFFVIAVVAVPVSSVRYTQRAFQYGAQCCRFETMTRFVRRYPVAIKPD